MLGEMCFSSGAAQLLPEAQKLRHKGWAVLRMKNKPSSQDESQGKTRDWSEEEDEGLDVGWGSRAQDESA